MFDRASFEQMVRGGYPEIAHSSSATVDGSRRGDAGEIYLFVRVLGDNGRTIEAVYELVSEGGGWRINGVVSPPRLERARVASRLRAAVPLRRVRAGAGDRKTSSAADPPSRRAPSRSARAAATASTPGRWPPRRR